MLSRSSRAVVLLTVLLLPWTVLAALSPEIQKALDESKYVYISSMRKAGNYGQPAEIWFFVDGGAVYVGTRPGSWRVKRIKAGRPTAKIAVGTAGGPSFTATGSVVKDPAVEARLLEAFATKYPDRWSTHEQSFREGFKDGSRVLVKYVPN
jgi:hypothetical protein